MSARLILFPLCKWPPTENLRSSRIRCSSWLSSASDRNVRGIQARNYGTRKNYSLRTGLYRSLMWWFKTQNQTFPEFLILTYCNFLRQRRWKSMANTNCSLRSKVWISLQTRQRDWPTCRGKERWHIFLSFRGSEQTSQLTKLSDTSATPTKSACRSSDPVSRRRNFIRAWDSALRNTTRSSRHDYSISQVKIKG